ncbi:response regulator transcription factor [Okibacterium endophyticum]
MTTARAISIVVADDHRLVREGLAAILRTDPTLTVVAEAATGEEAYSAVVEQSPDVLLLDVEMPGPPTAQTIRRIRRNAPAVHIAVLTMHTSRVLGDELRLAGASAFLTKSLGSTAIISAVRALSDKDADALQDDATARSGGPRKLSAREARVLQLIGRAHSNARIAKELGIAPGTVKRHISNIFRKLDAESRIDAVNKARLYGVLDMGP